MAQVISGCRSHECNTPAATAGVVDARSRRVMALPLDEHLDRTSGGAGLKAVL
jgi:hypothetical protein